MDESSASPRMNQYEKGKHTPDVQTLKLIADELGVPLSYFFCRDSLDAQLITSIDQLSPANKKKLLMLIEKLKDEENE